VPITISECKTEPSPCPAGEVLTASCRVVSDEGRVISVKVTIPRLGDFDLYDDGTHGDATAGDGIYSRRETIPFLAPRGKYELEVTAQDDRGTTASARLPVEIV